MNDLSTPMVSDIQWSVSKWYYQYNGWTKKYLCHKAASFWCQLFLKKKNTGFREEYENVAFLYVSDDMAWGKKNIKNKKKDLVRILPFHLISFFDSRVSCGKQDS